MNIQIIRRGVYLQLFILFVFLLISVILTVSGSVKSFAESNKDSENQSHGSVTSKQATENSVRESAKLSPTRWITFDENELRLIQNVNQNKGEGFDLKVVEKRGGLSVVESDERNYPEAGKTFLQSRK